MTLSLRRMRWIQNVGRFWRRVLAAMLLPITVASSFAFTASDANTMINSFNTAFHYTANGGTSFRNTTDGGEVWFWGRANQMEMLLDIHDRTGNPLYLTQFTTMYSGFVADYGSNWIWNEFNDDIMWMVIACARAYQKTLNVTYRDAARNNFDSCYARAWSSDLGGGLWWKSPLNTSKNACVNGPGAIAAYLLYQIYGDTNYLAKAQAIFQWERNNLFEPATGKIYDSMHISGSKDMVAITYNQGTFIGAAHLLGHTNDAMLAANYTKNSMTSAGGILPQYEEDSDLGGFNGIFLRWMSKYMRERGLESQFQPWLQQNANAAWNMRRADNLSWTKWRQSTPAGTRYSFGCWGSVLAMHVVPPTQIPNAPSVPLLASDAPGTSSFESGLNWSNQVPPSVSNNFVVSELELRTPADALNRQFLGGSLTVSNSGVLRLMSSSSGRVISIGTELNLDSGSVAVSGGQSTELAGWINLKAGGGVFDPQNVTLTVASPVAGPGMLRIESLTSAISGTVVLACENSYTGGTLINTADTLQLSGAGTLGPTNASLTFSNTMNRGPGTLSLGGRDLSLGNVTGLIGSIVNNNSSTNAVLTLGNGNAGGGMFAGTIRDRTSGTGTLSLVKRGTNIMTLGGANPYPGGTTISGGTLQFGDGATRNGAVLGNISIASNAVLTFANPFSQVCTGNISGAGRLMKIGGGLLTLSGSNTFAGGTLISAGTLQIGDGSVLPGGIVGVISNHAALIFASSQAQRFGGTLAGTGSLTKSGMGVLTLSGTNLYSGPTVIGSGTIALTGLTSMASSPLLTLGSSGVLDVRGRTDRTLTLGATQTLAGAGTVQGRLVASAGSLIEPGVNGLGVLTVQSNVTLAGTVIIELNRGGIPTSDRLSSPYPIAAGGALVLTNKGSELQAGDSFQVFNQAVSGFETIELAPLSAGLIWTNKLAVDGTLQVLATVSSVPTQLSLQVNENGLTLSWPSDHIGWRLQTQNPSLMEGLGTNWLDVAGSTATNEVFLPIDFALDSVFFRLIYP
jgi:autotransporter-associated beta strand protein